MCYGCYGTLILGVSLRKICIKKGILQIKKNTIYKYRESDVTNPDSVPSMDI